MQVAVDQPGQQMRAGQVDLVRAAIVADADDVSLVDGDVGGVDLVGQDVDDPRVLQYEVWSLAATGSHDAVAQRHRGSLLRANGPLHRARAVARSTFGTGYRIGLARSVL